MEEFTLRHRRAARALQIVAGQPSGRLVSGPVVLWGYSFRESTGAAAAVVRIRDGQDLTGAIMLSVQLAAGLSDTSWATSPGVAGDVGLYLEVVSGAVEGAIYYTAF